MQVLGARNRILGVEQPDTINAMANLAATYRNLGKYTEAEKLQVQVLDASNRILRVEHPDTISAMKNQGLSSAPPIPAGIQSFWWIPEFTPECSPE